MTAAETTSNSEAGSATGRLLAELTSVGDAARGQSWAMGDLGAWSGDPRGLDAAASPLSALSDAGFDAVRQWVSFLEDPLKQLAGDSGSVASAAQDSRGTGDELATLAGTYRAAVGGETGDWSGDAAEAYRTAGTACADGIAAIGQAAATVSSAISGAGGAVARTARGVRQDITDGVGEMLPILTTARAQAGATHGASMAEAIPQCVRIAESYGQRILARMRALLSSGQNLKGLVEKVVSAIEAIERALRSRADGPAPNGKQQSPGPDGSQDTGGSSGTGSANATAGTSAQTSADQTAAGQTSAGQTSAGQTTRSGSAGSATAPAAHPSSGTAPGGRTSGSPASFPVTASPGSTSVSSAPLAVPKVGSGLVPAVAGDHPISGSTARGGPVIGLPGLTGDGGRSTGGTSAAKTSASGAAGGGMIGGQTAGGGKRAEDKEHTSPAWLRGADGLFDPDEPVVPPVIDAPLDPEDDVDEVMPPRRPAPVEPRPAAILPRAEPLPQREEREQEEEKMAEPVKMTWQMSEDGELELVPSPAP
jgi:hypothetical protein